MAVVNPPISLQNAGNTHTAESTRSAVSMFQAGPRAASSLIPRGGIHPHLGGQCAVTQNGSPNMSVNVANGVLAIPGTEGATQGEYIAVASTTTNLAIAAAHATLPRIDIVVAKVEDSAYSGANNTWSLVVVTGTAAGSPTAPAAPANSITLANVAVAAAVTTILNANITDVRPYSAVGIIYVKDTSSYPSPAMGGMVAYVKSTGQLAVYNENSAVWQNPNGSQFLQRVVITATGSFVKATYPGLKKVFIEVQADGGGGAGAQAAASGQCSSGGGGGGGGYANKWVDASALASSETVTIGTGGAGGVGNASGTAGTGASFGAHVVATAGGGGTVRGSNATAYGEVGGDGGIGTAGDVLVGGSAGGMCWGEASLSYSGPGGGSYMGGGGRGVRGISAGTQSNGNPGKTYGGGGSGAFSTGTGAAATGGAGAAAVAIVSLYV